MVPEEVGQLIRSICKPKINKNAIFKKKSVVGDPLQSKQGEQTLPLRITKVIDEHNVEVNWLCLNQTDIKKTVVIEYKKLIEMESGELFDYFTEEDTTNKTDLK